MMFLGLLLIIAGAAAIFAAIFISEGQGELLGIDMSTLGVFLVGVAAGAAVLWGISILKWGTKRGLARRRERKELTELNAKLERVEAERRAEDGTEPTA